MNTKSNLKKVLAKAFDEGYSGFKGIKTKTVVRLLDEYLEYKPEKICPCGRPMQFVVNFSSIDGSTIPNQFICTNDRCRRRISVTNASSDKESGKIKKLISKAFDEGRSGFKDLREQIINEIIGEVQQPSVVPVPGFSWPPEYTSWFLTTTS